MADTLTTILTITPSWQSSYGTQLVLTDLVEYDNSRFLITDNDPITFSLEQFGDSVDTVLVTSSGLCEVNTTGSEIIITVNAVGNVGSTIIIDGNTVTGVADGATPTTVQYRIGTDAPSFIDRLVIDLQAALDAVQSGKYIVSETSDNSISIVVKDSTATLTGTEITAGAGVTQGCYVVDAANSGSWIPCNQFYVVQGDNTNLTVNFLQIRRHSSVSDDVTVQLTLAGK